MCGIAGIYNLYTNRPISPGILKNTTGILRHRGPDGCGYYRDDDIGMSHTRLSIVGVRGGNQPIHNEDGTIWITFNGEIFNYRELREGLIKKGHFFHTDADTEVVVHLYEEHGPDCVYRLNGQFAFAIWNRNTGELFIARDRLGVRPLFYTFAGGQLLFASEIKALFVDRRVKRQIDPRALDQICTFWVTIPPRTAFCDIFELPAGHRMKAKKGSLRIERYWEPEFGQGSEEKTEDEYAEQLLALLTDATKLRLPAGAPVGAYLSGGIDSSSVTALAGLQSDRRLHTFSVLFSDRDLNEGGYQQAMTESLKTDHSSVLCTHADIGNLFPEIVWHVEQPVLRTAPAPLYLLSKLAHDNRCTVILSGEGADEILAGYDIFKEVKVRLFLERQPGSKLRPAILRRLYPYLSISPVRSLQYARAFLTANGSRYPAVYASHIPRWNTTAKIKMFFSDQVRETLSAYKSTDELSLFLDPHSGHGDMLVQAQYIEMKTLLPGYLLSAQGDRMAMAHSVECRYPFLDHRVVDFCNALPANMKMRALTEKYLLKKGLRTILPASIIRRHKQPYRAPDAMSFFRPSPPEYVRSLLSPENLVETGYFDKNRVAALVKKCALRPLLGFKDNMAMVCIISTLLLHDLFIKNFSRRAAAAVEQERAGQGANAY